MHVPFRILVPCVRFTLGTLLAAAALHCNAVFAADIHAGQAKAESCVACHGAAGIAQMEAVPSLAGQPDGFLQWQLVYFRSHTRKNPQMMAMAAGLSNEDVRNLAAYFSSLTPPVAPPEADNDVALTAAGALLVQKNNCVSCHQASMKGQQAIARLANQREDYLLTALRDYKSGVRTGGGVGAMLEVVSPLADHDLAALAHYLARFDGK